MAPRYVEGQAEPKSLGVEIPNAYSLAANTWVSETMRTLWRPRSGCLARQAENSFHLNQVGSPLQVLGEKRGDRLVYLYFSTSPCQQHWSPLEPFSHHPSPGHARRSSKALQRLVFNDISPNGSTRSLSSIVERKRKPTRPRPRPPSVRCTAGSRSSSPS